ncbi:MAG: class I SAM-dependent methyltransferase [Ferruginibacter sp.]
MQFIKKSYSCTKCNQDNAGLLFVKQGYNIVKCRNCGFVYVNPRVLNEQLGIIYQQNYFTNNDYGYSGYEQEKALRVKNFEKWIGKSEKFINGDIPVRALDIGCAAGYCLEVMQGKGWHVEGLELDEKMCSELKAKGFSAHHKLLENFETDQKYSLITLFDVIEHIPDVDAAFQQLYKITNENGIVVMVTPDYNSIQRKIMRKKWFQYKPVEHIQYFTKDSISSFAERNNFKAIYISVCGQYADVNFLINRLRYYHFSSTAFLISGVLRLLNIKNRFFYIDTGSLFVVFKKK